ncbi:Outer membrane protein A precursor [hydrothermal vent metagenome]|uniref:Outer membrane protein A n=1 Tax=hydrothermal vent metagenome TaxID=652676 RepID=A0A1W1BDK2_9ZZZZ
MKKLLLIPTLLSSFALANEYKYEISPMVGYNLSEGNIGIKDDGHYLGALEIQFNSPKSKFSPEFSIMYSPKADYDGSHPDDTSITRGAFNGVYTFDAKTNLTPFVKAGVGIEDIHDETSSNQTGFFLDAGAGLKYSFADNIAFKAETIYLAKATQTQNKYIDNNLVAMVGLTFAFGKTNAEQPVVVFDDDKDGVVNKNDQCPNTPAGVKVDVKGCELDSDNDGVVDSKDACPNTIAGVKVDTKGCEVDSDHDGVVDSQDVCPNTLVGTKVDAKGCELDSDNDGVADSKDACPNTIAGIKVDFRGCDLDTDKDGVVDSKDICPNTPKGEKVNSDGCPKIVELEINFENNSAVIKEESQDQVDKYATFLKDHKNYSAHIIGYTDSRGSAKYNQKLSQKRAKAVVDALIAKGVDPAQLSYEGKGEANPVADNATAEGRAKNRRIEAALTRH